MHDWIIPVIWIIGIFVLTLIGALICYFKPYYVKKHDLTGAIGIVIIIAIVFWPIGIFGLMIGGIYCLYEYLIEKGKSK